jgi:ADP-dependent NAD(P)H-hydrate dehydratase / NAD(P)H-hydrate epimerase
MLPVLTAADMRAADRSTIEEIGLPGALLMENAGAAVAAAVVARYPGARHPVVVCGKGNNGGDGFVVARRLLPRGATAVLLARREEVAGDARVHLQAYEKSGGTLLEAGAPGAWTVAEARLRSADLVIDAVLGTGLDREPRGLAREAIASMRGAADRGVPVVAIDLPSGVPTDSGQVPWPAVRASLTVTFAAAKLGHVLPPACDLVGELIVADIGIPESCVEATGWRVGLIEARDAERAFGARAPAAHKGTLGHVLVVAGSLGKTGAAVLASTAALRAGAGLVTLATAEKALHFMPGLRPEVMAEPLAATAAGAIGKDALDRALALADSRDAVVLGPGLGQEAATREFVREFLARCSRPLVVDADGLNALGALGDPGTGPSGPWSRERAMVLTPHPGEMARLMNTTVADVQSRRLDVARALSLRTGAHVILKGQRTLVAEPSGRVAVNPTGNPGMATGGTGDVLAGLVGALLARHDAGLAAVAAVFVHGRAGDLAAARLGQSSLLAGDLIDDLPRAVVTLGTEGGAPSVHG